MSYVKGAIFNELEKILRKRRLAIVLIILAALQILATILANMDHETPSNTNWEQTLQQEVSALESQIPQVPADQAEQKAVMQRELERKKFQLKHHVNPNPEGAAGDAISTVTAPFISTILPLLMIVIGADVVSGEVSDGTLKSVLVRPVGRATILFSKWAAFILFSIVIMAFSDVLSYVLALFTSGVGNLTDQLVIGTDTIRALPIWQYLLIGYGLNIFTIIILSSVILLISVLVRSASVSVSLSMILIVVGGLLTNLGTRFAWMKFFFLPHLDLVAHLTDTFRLPNVTLMESMLVMSVTAAISLLIAFGVFTKKDMLI